MARAEGERYRPSNGSEGDWFTSKFCEKCRHDDPENGRFCEILTNALVFDFDEPEYPSAWVYSENGSPVCTAFMPIEEWRRESDEAAEHRKGEKGQGRLF